MTMIVGSQGSRAFALSWGGAILLTCVSGISVAAAADVTAGGDAFMASSAYAAASGYIAANFDRMLSDVVTFTQIPAPPFGEAKRAAAFAKSLQAVGLRDVEIDGEGNVTGLRKGTGGKGLLVVAAHLDTVFPANTDVTVHKDGNRLAAPGVSDDTASLSVLLTLVRALDAAHIATRDDILFVGDVGEEGPGDLRGMKYLFKKGKYAGRITQFISIEQGADGAITVGGTGSKRYELTFTGPGGHSYEDFGMVNPAVAMAGTIMKMLAANTPDTPKTTWNFGVFSGGTSVNTIPSSLTVAVDLRSDDAGELKRLDKFLTTAVEGAVKEENARHSTAAGTVAASFKLIGERPTGRTAETTSLIRIASAAFSRAGARVRYEIHSTDANIPMSLGIAAMTIGNGIDAFQRHALGEYLVVDKDLNTKMIAADLAVIVGAANL
jgi:acetylornithine deacetylase/succinyl-diaminopimelate desuccinylase-like protein